MYTGPDDGPSGPKYVAYMTMCCCVGQHLTVCFLNVSSTTE
jgi:hypothetical protein